MQRVEVRGEKYRALFSSYLGVNPNQVSLFWKGRVGFYGLLQALKVDSGDEVIIPAFTCVVVSNAIIYHQAVPKYAEVDPKTFNMDIASVESLISPKTKVIVAQNTFGLSADLDPLKALAEKNNIILIEDCTHGFGGTYKNQPNGSVADAAFFSTQWNKPFSSGVGGIVVCKNESLAQEMLAWEQSLPAPGRFKSASLALQIFLRKNVMKPWLYWPLLKLYRWLSHTGILSGSSSGMELESTQMPADYLMKMGSVQMQAGYKALQNWPKNLNHRKEISKIYSACLHKLGYSPVWEPDYADHTFIKYPVLVKDRTSLFAKAIKEQVPLGDWMLSPIHPIQKDFSKWMYDYGKNPQAEYLSKHVINLQTDLGISVRMAKKCCAFLEKHQDQLLR